MDLIETEIESRAVYDGALLHARRDTVRLPSGAESVREWIDHPGASAVVPIFEDGTTLLVRQFRYPARRVFWEVPAGKLDIAGESPVAVAIRELEEETGWCSTNCERIGSYFPCIGYSNEVIHVFAAFDLEKGHQHLSEGELLEPVRLPFLRAVDMVFEGEIDDMKTITALLLTRRWLAENRPQTRLE
ncbi:MAG: NUDIX hydrolase [Bacteroidetes bacterium]|nr:NUDIX hydrolase [Bacteroidota bacterium]